MKGSNVCVTYLVVIKVNWERSAQVNYEFDPEICLDVLNNEMSSVLYAFGYIRWSPAISIRDHIQH